MADGLCPTCKFWGWPGDTGEFRTCYAFGRDEECMTRVGEDVHAEDKARVVAFRRKYAACVSGSDLYGVSVKTRRDFGCVLHTPGVPSYDDHDDEADTLPC